MDVNKSHECANIKATTGENKLQLETLCADGKRAARKDEKKREVGKMERHEETRMPTDEKGPE